MDGSIASINTASAAQQQPLKPPKLIPTSMSVAAPKDILQLGAGEQVDSKQAMYIVLERSFEKLRAVVAEARAELGTPENTVLDTSPEATANRIADFALGAFGAWQKNHAELGEEEARKQFADFIGGAIQQGIGEARGILGALNALTPEVQSNIDQTWVIIQDRLDYFVGNN